VVTDSSLYHIVLGFPFVQLSDAYSAPFVDSIKVTEFERGVHPWGLSVYEGH